MDKRRIFLPEFSCSEKCPLHGGAKVGFDLPAEADAVDILFLGVNPGKREMVEGRPFCGPSGRILREIVRESAAALRVGYGNTILCGTRNERDIPFPEQVRAHCLPHVRRLAAQTRARHYVAVGKGAALALLQNEAAGKTLPALTRRAFRGGRVFVVPHPAAILYGGGETLRRELAGALAWIVDCIEKAG